MEASEEIVFGRGGVQVPPFQPTGETDPAAATWNYIEAFVEANDAFFRDDAEMAIPPGNGKPAVIIRRVQQDPPRKEYDKDEETMFALGPFGQSVEILTVREDAAGALEEFLSVGWSYKANMGNKAEYEMCSPGSDEDAPSWQLLARFVDLIR